MLIGWHLINGKWYYFAAAPGTHTWIYDAEAAQWIYDTATKARPFGSLYVNTRTPDNFTVNADGIWLP